MAKIIGGGCSNSLLNRRCMMMETAATDDEYVTSITGERIKVLQVMPKDLDPEGKSIHDEIYEENGKRYIKKNVKDGITGQWKLPDPIPVRPSFVPPINAMSGYTSIAFPNESAYKKCTIWIHHEGIETIGWNSNYFHFYKDNPKKIGIAIYSAFPNQPNIINPNSLSVDEVNEILSFKPFRYAVAKDDIKIIEII